MTTTAHEDQFTTAPEPVRQPYDTAAILRRNVADLELALRTQTERAESYAETLRSIASYVGAGGYNSDTVDAGVFEEKIRWGICEIMTRAEAAEAEMTKAREQKPAGYVFGDWRGATTISAVKSGHFNTPLYLHPEPPPPQQSQWQPIATAPIDTPVLVSKTPTMGICVAENNGDGKWYLEIPNGWEETEHPTHWMPLPEPAP